MPSMLSMARTIAAALTVFIAAAMCTGQAWPRDLPDPTLTPGVLNPQVTPSTIKTTICKRGWTKTVRPPVSYTDNLKLKQIAQYGYSDKNPTHYEEDHFIPLELGGNPSDEKNLWPQPRTGQWTAQMKDNLENVLNKRVCSGQMTLSEAQRAIRSDWRAAYKKYVGATGASKK